MQQIYLALRRLNSWGRFLLKGVKYPNIRAEFHCIDDPKRVTAVTKDNLQHAGAKALQRLRVVRFSALGRDR